MLKMVVGLLREDRGLAIVEYGLLIALIALVVVAAVTSMGTQLSTNFSNLAAQMAS